MFAFFILSSPNNDTCYVLCLYLFLHKDILKCLKDSIRVPSLLTHRESYTQYAFSKWNMTVLLRGDDLNDLRIFRATYFNHSRPWLFNIYNKVGCLAYLLFVPRCLPEDCWSGAGLPFHHHSCCLTRWSSPSAFKQYLIPFLCVFFFLKAKRIIPIACYLNRRRCIILNWEQSPCSINIHMKWTNLSWVLLWLWGFPQRACSLHGNWCAAVPGPEPGPQHAARSWCYT